LFISLEVIATLVSQLREDLTRDAMRTIRQRKAEEGVACLERIEGVELLQRSIALACQSVHYRETGDVLQVEPNPIKKGKLPKPVSVVRPRVRSIDKAAGE
jgi:hypothetical protein